MSDYDLSACLIYNDVGIAASDIQSVLAVWEGENDGDSWRWVLRLNDGRYAFLDGWCDYTGWDCQSGAEITFSNSANAAASNEPKESVRSSLYQQIGGSKDVTWREETDAKLGVMSEYQDGGTIIIPSTPQEANDDANQ